MSASLQPGSSIAHARATEAVPDAFIAPCHECGDDVFQDDVTIRLGKVYHSDCVTCSEHWGLGPCGHCGAFHCCAGDPCDKARGL